MESQRGKLDEKEDRISDLPDHIIHHILSLLLSTKDSVRTGILSKRWRNQWTQVPVLIFNSITFGMSSENFHKFVDDTLILLHDCPKIKKFHLEYLPGDRKDTKLDSKIRFATTKGVEELHLILNYEYMLPEFLFNNASLFALNTVNCTFRTNIGKVNWECLTILCMGYCRITDQVMDLILSGSPLLELIIFLSCSGFKKLVIASKSLKILCLASCRYNIFDIEISCPMLEELILEGGLNVRTAKLSNLPSSLTALINFNHHENECNDSRMSLIKDILNQLRHVKKLVIGGWFMEHVSAISTGGQFSPVLNIKRLILKSHNVSGIMYFLLVLEILVIEATLYDKDYQNFGVNYWSDAPVFNCLASHLKIIKIIGFPETDGKRKFMLNFVQFFLKNARVLEKIIIELKDDGTAFPLDVSQELLSLPRCSQSAIIEVYSK